MRRSFAVSPLSSFLGPYGILPPLPLRRRRLQMFHLPFSLSPLLSLSLFYFSLFLSLILLLCLSPTGFGWSRFSSVLLTVRIPPPAIGECMQCSCVFSLALPPVRTLLSLPPLVVLLRIQVETPPLCVMRHVFKPDT